MRAFTSQHSISNVERIVYSGSPSRGVLTSTGNTYTGYLHPLSEEQASLNGYQWGIAFSLITETDADIRQGDRVTIDGVMYLVRGRADHTRGARTQYLRFLITKPEA